MERSDEYLSCRYSASWRAESDTLLTPDGSTESKQPRGFFQRLTFLIRCLNVGRHVNIQRRRSTKERTDSIQIDNENERQPSSSTSTNPAGNQSSLSHYTYGSVNDIHSPDMEDKEVASHVTHSQDGFISAQCWFVLLLALDISLVVTSHLKKHHFPAVPFKLTFFAQNVLSTFLLILTLCKQDYFMHPKDDTKCKLWQRMLRDNIELLCMLLFLIIGMFRDIFQIYVESRCMPVYSESGIFEESVVHLSLRLSRSVFTIAQFGFCILVHHRHFKKTWWASYTLFTIAATTLGIWFALLAEEFKHDDLLPKPKHDYNHSSTTFAFGCLNPKNESDSYLFRLESTVSNYTYTVHIEYAVLVTEVLFHLIYSMKEANRTVDTNNQELELDVALHVGGEKLELCHELREELFNVVQLRNEMIDMYNKDVSLTSSDSQSSSTTKRMTGLVVTLSSLSALLFSVMLLAFGFMLPPKDGECLDLDDFSNYKHMVLVYFIVLLCVCLFAFWASESLPTRYISLSKQTVVGLEHILLITAIGPTITLFFSLYPNVDALNNHSESGVINATHCNNNDNDTCGPCNLTDNQHQPLILVIFVSKLLFIMEIFMQTTLVMHLKNLKMPEIGLNQKCVLLGCVIWIVIGNATLWILTSFVNLKNDNGNPMRTAYYGEYNDDIKHILIPFEQLYRISSVFLFSKQLLQIS